MSNAQTNPINPAHNDTEEITNALVGRRIVAIKRVKPGPADATWYLEYGDRAFIVLDDGTMLQLDGHDGGCSCSAGCYSLQHLANIADVDNIITAVHFENNPAGDNYANYEGSYSIFVVADDKRINLATFEGTDGNGYYGTGYYVRVFKETP